VNAENLSKSPLNAGTEHLARPKQHAKPEVFGRVLTYGI
jgi:hypothetical protein